MNDDGGHHHTDDQDNVVTFPKSRLLNRQHIANVAEQTARALYSLSFLSEVFARALKVAARELHERANGGRDDK